MASAPEEAGFTWTEMRVERRPRARGGSAAPCSETMTMLLPVAAIVPGMAPGTQLAPVDDIAAKIHTVRGVHVMLDADLAALYGVNTKQLNQAVRRNADRFPGDFAFHLNREELAALRSQFVTSKIGRGGRRYAPRAFTEHGAVMAATVLNSPRAVQMSIFVVRAYLRLRGWVVGQADLAARLAELERRVGAHDHELKAIIQTIRGLLEPPLPSKKRIGFRQS